MAHNLKSCLNRRSSLVLHDLYSVLISAPAQLSYPILPTLASAEIAYDNDRVNPLAGSRTSTQDYLWLEWGCGPEPHSKCWRFSLWWAATFCAVLCNHSVLIWEQVLIEGYTVGTTMDLMAKGSCLYLPLTHWKSAELWHVGLNENPSSAAIHKGHRYLK